MQQLAMKGGRFSVVLRALEAPTAAGMEEVEFEVSSHPSLPLRPLAKVASGGELSRVSLALQLVTAKASPVATLVFDEVDAGIGGATAQVVGEQIRAVADTRQVLCVTHLAQIAAFADAHFSVAKSIVDGRTETTVTPLAAAARRDEISRMLGGAKITKRSRAHAEELLLNAAR
jgi:DNA repair protein RecN (Recombination protein N)